MMQRENNARARALAALAELGGSASVVQVAGRTRMSLVVSYRALNTAWRKGAVTRSGDASRRDPEDKYDRVYTLIQEGTTPC